MINKEDYEDPAELRKYGLEFDSDDLFTKDFLKYFRDTLLIRLRIVEVKTYEEDELWTQKPSKISL